jgi:putative NIF3 family GTP cyclohydrolase 1 type 2
MKLSEFYKLVVTYGSDRDPRRILPKNPYPDSAVLYGDPNTDVRTVMVGIDIDVGTLVLADRIRQRQGLDLVIAHHPEGHALARLHEVMQLQVDVLAGMGISRMVAQQYLDERMREVQRRLMSGNHAQVVDAARLLNMPFMCMHTPADNHVYAFIKKLLINAQPKKVHDIVDILMKLPEYHDAHRNGAGPRIILGSPHRAVGKVSVEMTGGTEGPRDIFDKMRKKGIRTLVCMHLSEDHFKKVRDVNLNVVIAGHISSDTVGLNLLLDRLQKKQALEVIECSGFRRVKRS